MLWIRRSRRRSGCIFVLVYMCRDVGPELNKERPQSALGIVGQAALYGKAYTTVLLVIIKIGNSTGDEVSKNVGVVPLPLAVVAFASHSGGERIPESFGKFASSHSIITRVLMKKDWQYGVADDGAVEGVPISSAEAFAIAGRPPAIALVIVLGLTQPCIQSSGHKLKGVHRAAKSEAKLLSWAERSSSTIDGIKVRNNAHNPLMLFLIEFLLGFIMLLLLTRFLCLWRLWSCLGWWLRLRRLLRNWRFRQAV